MFIFVAYVKRTTAVTCLATIASDLPLCDRIREAIKRVEKMTDLIVVLDAKQLPFGAQADMRLKEANRPLELLIIPFQTKKNGPALHDTRIKP